MLELRYINMNVNVYGLIIEDDVYGLKFNIIRMVLELYGSVWI